MKAIGLALCKHDGCERGYLFQMPRYERLAEGDRVIVETKNGEKEAEVLKVATTYTDEDLYHMILLSYGAHEPLKKVLRKVMEKELRYDEDDLSVWEDRDGRED